jgi:hypothetical protein
MKFALVDGQRLEARQDLAGACPVCRSALIAKCGEYREHHWAHRNTRNCDPWWERETDWHRAWKNRFPADWQERVRWADDGEKHIADIMTASGVVLEFQHSPLSRQEREAREAFYKKMAWVVDGTRRKHDRSRFFRSIGIPRIVLANPLTLLVSNTGDALFRDWSSSPVPIFFDFGDASEADDPLKFAEPVLWRLMPQADNKSAYVAPVAKASFCESYLNGTGLGGFDCSATHRPVVARLPAPRPPQSTGFQQYMARRQFARSRRRF